MSDVFEIKVLAVQKNPKTNRTIPPDTYTARLYRTVLIDLIPSAQIIEGPYTGEIIPFDNYTKLKDLPCEHDYQELQKAHNKLKQDNAQLRSELQQMKEARDMLQQKSVIADVFLKVIETYVQKEDGSELHTLKRLLLELEELRKKVSEKEMDLVDIATAVNSFGKPLLETIKDRMKELEQLRERCKPVVIPLDVVIALNYLFNVAELDWKTVVLNYASGKRIFYDNSPEAKILSDFAADNFPVFLRALVNNYTAAPELSLRDRILNIIDSSEDLGDAADNLLVLIREESKANEAS